MWPRLSIVAGLVAGIATAALLFGGLLLLTPDLAPALTPAPQPSLVASASPAVSPPPAAGASPSSDAPGPSASVDPDALFMVGQPAPALVVPQVGGGTIDLTNLRGTPVWVNFMGTYCPPCVDEFPLMNGYATTHAEDGLVVLAISVKEEEGVVAAFATGLNTTFPLGLDADGTAAERWGAAAALPVHFWVDADGIIRDGALGGIGPDVMAAGLRTIMPGVDVSP
jgi:peroxiredoxin